MGPRRLAFALGLVIALSPAGSRATNPRERAIEQIPELMGRILDAQEEIRATEASAATELQRYDRNLERTHRAIEEAGSEEAAAAALVEYIESYSARLEEQGAGLSAIQQTVMRMRGDARELARVAEVARVPGHTPEARRAFFADHYQGIAAATSELAGRLGRDEEAAATGSVLEASWGVQSGLAIPAPEIGAEGAIAFARKVEGLYARVQARSQQLRAERRSVRHLLDVLIERQLAKRLDTLFEGSGELSLAALLGSGADGSHWENLNELVRRTTGLPPGDTHRGFRESPAYRRLEHFVRGDHRH